MKKPITLEISYRGIYCGDEDGQCNGMYDGEVPSYTTCMFFGTGYGKDLSYTEKRKPRFIRCEQCKEYTSNG